MLWTGECVPCCWDADGEQIIGDVRNETLVDIWQGKRHKKCSSNYIRETGVLSLCDKCTGPISDNIMGLREQVNAHALRWIKEGKRVVLAAASKAMFDLYEKTQLRNLNVAAFCDINPEGKVPPVNIPVLPNCN